MIKSLFILSSSLTLFSQGLYKNPIDHVENNVVERNRSNVVIENDVQITYKYDTNEVNSASDLISGNIYKFDLELFADNLPTSNTNLCVCNGFYAKLSNGSVISDFNTDTTILYNVNGTVYIYTTNQPVSLIYTAITDFAIVFNRLSSSPQLTDLYLYLSICPNELNQIVDVERVYPDSIFGYVAQFIDESILNGIPLIDSVTNTINGQNVTLRAWLCTSITIVLAILLVVFLVLFIRWLFRLLAGLLSHN